MDNGTHKIEFENSIKSFNRLLNKNRQKFARETIINLLQEPLKRCLSCKGPDFYKIFQKRTALSFEIKDGFIYSLKFFPKDERDSTLESCYKLNNTFSSLDYEILSLQSRNEEIDTFNIFLNTKPIEKKEKPPETKFNINLNEIQNLIFN